LELGFWKNKSSNDEPKHQSYVEWLAKTKQIPAPQLLIYLNKQKSFGPETKQGTIVFGTNTDSACNLKVKDRKVSKHLTEWGLKASFFIMECFEQQ
jgi:hypothetical protein